MNQGRDMAVIKLSRQKFSVGGEGSDFMALSRPLIIAFTHVCPHSFMCPILYIVFCVLVARTLHASRRDA
jgi:hypothetical protein